MQDSHASQGECIALPVANHGSAVLSVAIPADGDYMIWCRILATEPGPISLSVSVDGGSEEPNALLAGAESNNWQWVRLSERSFYYSSNAPPKLLPLTAGSHTIHLGGGSQTTWIDSLLFTDDPTTNIPPVIGSISGRVMTLGTPMSFPFTVTDIGSPLTALDLTVASSNPSLVPNTSIAFGGDNVNRTVTITPAPTN